MSHQECEHCGARYRDGDHTCEENPDDRIDALETRVDAIDERLARLDPPPNSIIEYYLETQAKDVEGGRLLLRDALLDLYRLGVAMGARAGLRRT